jgi:hypothetical protein
LVSRAGYATWAIMDTFDARFQRLADALRQLDAAEPENVLCELEERLFETETLLSPEQIEEVKRCVAGPQVVASREEVEAVFAKYGTRK